MIDPLIGILFFQGMIFDWNQHSDPAPTDSDWYLLKDQRMKQLVALVMAAIKRAFLLCSVSVCEVECQETEQAGIPNLGREGVWAMEVPIGFRGKFPVGGLWDQSPRS